MAKLIWTGMGNATVVCAEDLECQTIFCMTHNLRGQQIGDYWDGTKFIPKEEVEEGRQADTHAHFLRGCAVCGKWGLVK